MKRSDIEDMAVKTPFRPFTLETSGSPGIDVLRAEDVFLPARRPDLVIIFDFAGHMHLLDTEHITGAVTK